MANNKRYTDNLAQRSEPKGTPSSAFKSLVDYEDDSSEAEKSDGANNSRNFPMRQGRDERKLHLDNESTEKTRHTRSFEERPYEHKGDSKRPDSKKSKQFSSELNHKKRTVSIDEELHWNGQDHLTASRNSARDKQSNSRSLKKSRRPLKSDNSKYPEVDLSDFDRLKAFDNIQDDCRNADNQKKKRSKRKLSKDGGHHTDDKRRRNSLTDGVYAQKYPRNIDEGEVGEWRGFGEYPTSTNWHEPSDFHNNRHCPADHESDRKSFSDERDFVEKSESNKLHYEGKKQIRPSSKHYKVKKRSGKKSSLKDRDYSMSKRIREDYSSESFSRVESSNAGTMYDSDLPAVHSSDLNYSHCRIEENEYERVAYSRDQLSNCVEKVCHHYEPSEDVLYQKKHRKRSSDMTHLATGDDDEQIVPMPAHSKFVERLKGDSRVKVKGKRLRSSISADFSSVRMSFSEECIETDTKERSSSKSERRSKSNRKEDVLEREVQRTEWNSNEAVCGFDKMHSEDLRAESKEFEFDSKDKISSNSDRHPKSNRFEKDHSLWKESTAAVDIVNKVQSKDLMTEGKEFEFDTKERKLKNKSEKHSNSSRHEEIHTLGKESNEVLDHLDKMHSKDLRTNGKELELDTVERNLDKSDRNLNKFGRHSKTNRREEALKKEVHRSGKEIDEAVDRSNKVHSKVSRPDGNEFEINSKERNSSKSDRCSKSNQHKEAFGKEDHRMKKESDEAENRLDQEYLKVLIIDTRPKEFEFDSKERTKSDRHSKNNQNEVFLEKEVLRSRKESYEAVDYLDKMQSKDSRADHSENHARNKISDDQKINISTSDSIVKGTSDDRQKEKKAEPQRNDTREDGKERKDKGRDSKTWDQSTSREEKSNQKTLESGDAGNSEHAKKKKVPTATLR